MLVRTPQHPLHAVSLRLFLRLFRHPILCPCDDSSYGVGPQKKDREYRNETELEI